MSYVGVVLESTIQKKCNQILRDLGIPYLHLEKGSGNKCRQHRKGVPDILFWYQWHSFAVELKTEKGIVKPEQHEWLARLSAQGVYTAICRSVEEFEEFLKENKVMG